MIKISFDIMNSFEFRLLHYYFLLVFFYLISSCCFASSTKSGFDTCINVSHEFVEKSTPGFKQFIPMQEWRCQSDMGEYWLFDSTEFPFEALIFTGAKTDGEKCNFRGRIVDSRNNLPIPYAIVSSTDQELYLMSNSDGEFEIESDKFPVEIKIEKFGYNDENIIIESPGTKVIQLTAFEIHKKSDYRIQIKYARYLRIALNKIRKNSVPAVPDTDEKELVYTRIDSSVDTTLTSYFEGYAQANVSSAAIRNYRSDVARFASSGERVPGISANKFEYNIERSIWIPPNDLERYVHNLGYFKNGDKQIAIVGLYFGRLKTIFYINLQDTSVLYLNRVYNQPGKYKLPGKPKQWLVNKSIRLEVLFSTYGKKANLHRISILSEYETFYLRQKNQQLKNVSKTSLFSIIPDSLGLSTLVKRYVFNETLNRPNQQINYNSKYALSRESSDFNRETQKLNYKPYNSGFWDQNRIILAKSWEERQIHYWELNNGFYSENMLPPANELTRIDSLVNIMNYSKVPVENVFIELDRNNYLLGDTIWFSAFVLDNLKMDTASLSKFLYVDLINADNELHEHLKLLINNGRAKGDFQLGKELNSGIFRIRAYTQWMRNFQGDYLFEKKITILPSDIKDLITVNPVINNESNGDSVYLYLNTLLPAKYKTLEKKLDINVRLKDSIGIQKSFLFRDHFNGMLGFFIHDSISCISADVKLTLSDTALISEQRLSIPVASGLDLQFYPESGKLVAGIPTYVAFKAFDKKGNPAEFTADIVDEKNNPVLKIHADNKGMGKFPLTPGNGKNYKAVVTTTSHNIFTYTLPLTEPNGYVINYDPDSSRIFIRNNMKTGRSRHYLLLSVRGAVYTTMELNLKDEMVMFSPFFEAYPKGIVQITLFDSLFRPLAERLIFNNRPDHKMIIHVSPDKPYYKPKEKVTLNINVTDAKGNPVASTLAVSVVDASKTDTTGSEDNINSYLFLGSELKGKIDYRLFDPFDSTLAGRQNTDLVMMTQGWRNYLWNSIRYNKTLKEVFPNEEKLYIKGRISDADNQVPDKEYWFYLFDVKSGILKPGEIIYTKMDSVKMNRNGGFYFELPLLFDTHCLLIQNINEKGKADDIRFRVDTIPVPEIVPLNNELPYLSYAPGQIKSMNDKIVLTDSLNALIKSYSIPEVVVKARIPRYYSELDSTVDLEEKDPAGIKYSNIFEMIRGEFGDKAFTSKNGYQISPTILINGHKNHYGLQIPANEVFYMAFYEAGCRYSHFFGPKKLMDASFHDYAPVISLQLYSNWYRGAPFGSTIVLFQGIYEPREFYNPDYEMNKDLKPDSRTTIYWNPELKTDSTGKVKVSFYNSSLRGKAVIRLAGVSYKLKNAGSVVSSYESH